MTVIRIFVFGLVCALLSATSSAQYSGASATLYDEEWYQDCAAKAAHDTKGDRQLKVLLDVCHFKAVPKMCRDVSADIYPPSDDKLTWAEALGNRRGKGSLKEKCVIECLAAGYYSRTFGECSKG